MSDDLAKDIADVIALHLKYEYKRGYDAAMKERLPDNSELNANRICATCGDPVHCVSCFRDDQQEAQDYQGGT